MCNSVCTILKQKLEMITFYIMYYTKMIMCEPFYAFIVQQPYTFGVPWCSLTGLMVFK